FADLAGAFTDSLAKTVNIDSLLARSNGKDTVTGDSVAVDTTKRVAVVMKLDSSQAPYASADSGKLALGIRAGADSIASIAPARPGGRAPRAPFQRRCAHRPRGLRRESSAGVRRRPHSHRADPDRGVRGDRYADHRDHEPGAILGDGHPRAHHGHAALPGGR